MNVQEIFVCINEVLGVEVVKSRRSEDLFSKAVEEIRKLYRIENLKDDPTMKAFRNFYWKIGIDPTKQRPSSEALLRRVLRGKIPLINNVVDAGNIASIETLIPIGVYDLDKIRGNLRIRFAKRGEKFYPIDGQEEILMENQIVLADDEKVLHIYPYRDSKLTMVTESTKNVLIVACGVPGVEVEKVLEACKKASQYIVSLAGGKAGTCKIILPPHSFQQRSI